MSTAPAILWGPDSFAGLASPDTSWLWHGFLARGNITLLTSQWKSGKTTLVSVLLSKLQTGGDLAGLALAPACALVLSEESPDHWARRNARLRFGPNIGWICRPFTGRPSVDAWNDLIDHIASVARDRHIRLLVIDPLASFMAGGSENDPAAVLATSIRSSDSPPRASPSSSSTTRAKATSRSARPHAAPAPSPAPPIS